MNSPLLSNVCCSKCNYLPKPPGEWGTCDYCHSVVIIWLTAELVIAVFENIVVSELYYYQCRPFASFEVLTFANWSGRGYLQEQEQTRVSRTCYASRSRTCLTWYAPRSKSLLWAIRIAVSGFIDEFREKSLHGLVSLLRQERGHCWLS